VGEGEQGPTASRHNVLFTVQGQGRWARVNKGPHQADAASYSKKRGVRESESERERERARERERE
jgi:hypothetical protein